MMKALVPIAEGSEEMEAVIVIDTLRRASWDVVVAGLTDGPIKASRGVMLLPDLHWDEVDPDQFDILILPGGAGGTQAFTEHSGIQQVLRTYNEKNKWIAAVCAAPLALNKAGVLEGRRFTCYPGVEESMLGKERSNETVVIDNHLITSQGPGTSFEFALKIIAECDSPELAKRVQSGLLL